MGGLRERDEVRGKFDPGMLAPGLLEGAARRKQRTLPGIGPKTTARVELSEADDRQNDLDRDGPTRLFSGGLANA